MKIHLTLTNSKEFFFFSFVLNSWSSVTVTLSERQKSRTLEASIIYEWKEVDRLVYKFIASVPMKLSAQMKYWVLSEMEEKKKKKKLCT